MRLALLCLILCSVLIWRADAQEPDGPPPEQLPSIILPSELDRVLRDYETAWQDGDGAALALLFTEDGFVMSADRPPVRGRAAIEQRYAGAGGNLMLRALGYAVADTVGYIVGAYTYSEDGIDRGKFVLALRRRSSGHWLIAADIDNSNE